MTVQMPGQQQKGGRKWRRLLFIGLVLVFLIGVAIVWIANLGNVLASLLSIVFTLLGILIAFLQWPPQVQPAALPATKEKAPGERSQSFYEQIEGVTPEITKQKGALIVYTQRDLRGSTINLGFGFHSSAPKVDLASGIIGRKRKGRTVYLAVFSSLEPGNYTVSTDSRAFVTKVSILPGRVEEVDWR